MIKKYWKPYLGGIAIGLGVSMARSIGYDQGVIGDESWLAWARGLIAFVPVWIGVGLLMHHAYKSGISMKP